MSSSNPEKSSDKNLLEILVKKSLLSEAQRDLVESDAASTGMPVDEILLARGWVKETVLDELKPSPQEESKPATKTTAQELSYEENLKNYRGILGEILGESSE